MGKRIPPEIEPALAEFRDDESLDEIAIKIRNLDVDYRTQPYRARTPAVRREFVIRYLSKVTRVLGMAGIYYGETIHNELLEALQWAQSNKRHPLFALRGEEITRPRLESARDEVELTAAAILEHGSIVERSASQADWSRRIAKELGAAGYVKASTRRAYTPEAVIQWKRKAKAGGYRDNRRYMMALETLRNGHSEGTRTASNELEALVADCRRRFGRV